MKVKILKKSDKKMKFEITELTSALAGELRHIMVSEIPTMAIEWIDFHKNDSILWDEIMAQRLGLIPLTYDTGFYNMKDDCNCDGKGCVHCQVTFALKKKGPCTVYSSDLIPSDKKVKPVYDKIPITELMENQDLEFEATAELGLGKEHAKWQGAIVGYAVDKDKYTFNVETACGLSAEEIVMKSFDVLSEKLKGFISDLKRIK